MKIYSLKNKKSKMKFIGETDGGTIILVDEKGGINRDNIASRITGMTLKEKTFIGIGVKV